METSGLIGVGKLYLWLMLTRPGYPGEQTVAVEKVLVWRSIESSGKSRSLVETLEAAKSRLERKYGGQRRQINLYMEELDQFRLIRAGFAQDLGKLADLAGCNPH